MEELEEELEDKVADAILCDDLDQLKALLKEKPLDPATPLVESMLPVFFKNTPLMMACLHGNLNLVKAILSEPGGAQNMEDQNQFENTALILAAINNNIPIMHCLIAAGANVSMVTSGGESVLMKAAYHNQLDAVELLVQKGADVHWKNSYRHTVLHYAKKRSPKIALFLEGYLKAEREKTLIEKEIQKSLNRSKKSQARKNAKDPLSEMEDPSHQRRITQKPRL